MSKFLDESLSENDDLQFESTDEELISRKTNKRSKSSKKLPTKKYHLSIPKRKAPIKKPSTVIEETCLRLHASAVTNVLPCREEEYADIYSFIKGRLCSHTGGCMYISGMPGTGKTTTVCKVIMDLKQEKKNVPFFNFVHVNGMWITDPYQCYVNIFKALTGKTVTSQQAANLLEKHFIEPGTKKNAVILLIDELDKLWTRKQTVLYNLFEWPSKMHSKLIVLAIANMVNLPEKLMMNRISSRLGLTRKIFMPYDFKQLREIILSRVHEFEVFDIDAIQLVSRKVAAMSGDVRKVFDICRCALEIAGRNQASAKKYCQALVLVEHVDLAIEQLCSSPVMSAIRSASKLEKLFFRCVLADFKRTGSEETTLGKILDILCSSCLFEGMSPPSSSEAVHVCAHLAHSHLILVDDLKNGIYARIRLTSNPDDVKAALME